MVTTLANMNLWIIGDSTTNNESRDESLVSWGEVFHQKFIPAKVTVRNVAVSAYSMRDHINCGNWTKVMNEVGEGDVLLACHGHLEGAPLTKDVRGSRGSLWGDDDSFVVVTDPYYQREEEVRTFGWYVRKYIADSKARGVNLILLSPTTRAVWENEKIRRGKSLKYVNLMHAIAAETNTRFLDIGGCLADEFNQLGSETVAQFFGGDTLHTNRKGAEFVADVIHRSLVQAFPELFQMK